MFRVSLANGKIYAIRTENLNGHGELKRVVVLDVQALLANDQPVILCDKLEDLRQFGIDPKGIEIL